MSAKDGFEGEILDLLFLNIPIAGIGDSNGILGSASPGSYYISLYTVSPADPTQGTECNYNGYARVAVPRSSAGFARSGSAITNASAVAFPQCASGDTDQAVAFTINKGSATDVDDAILWGAVSPFMDISLGTTPKFDIGTMVTNVD